MKKLLFSLVSGIIIVGISTGCGNKSTPEENKNNNPNDNTTTSSKYERDSELPGTVSVNFPEIQYCMDAPSKQVYNRGNLYSKGHNESYFVIYDQYKDPSSKLNYDVELSQITKPSEVLNGVKKQFLNAVSDGLIRAREYDFKITNEKEVTVNGYNMYRFEGEIELLYEIENPNVAYTKTTFAGYSTIKDGIPMYFAVVNKPNENDQIDIGKMADKIVKSIREYDGNCSDD